MNDAWFVAVDVLAQTVKLAGSESPSLGEEVPAQRPAPELWHVEAVCPRCDGDAVDTCDKTRPSEKPERIASLGVEGTKLDDPAHRCWELITRACNRSSGHRFDCEFSDVIGDSRPADTFSKPESRGTYGTAVFERQIDASDIAGNKDRWMNPSRSADARCAERNEQRSCGNGTEKSRTDHEQLDHSEHATDRDRHQPGDDREHAVSRHGRAVIISLVTRSPIMIRLITTGVATIRNDMFRMSRPRNGDGDSREDLANCIVGGQA
jgi:hypothetical protein